MSCSIHARKFGIGIGGSGRVVEHEIRIRPGALLKAIHVITQNIEVRASGGPSASSPLSLMHPPHWLQVNYAASFLFGTLSNNI